jgi:ribosome biogenesis GTPase / thiamine phosphate phosphatase
MELKGIVTKSTGSWYNVTLEDGRKTEARIKGKFRMDGIQTTNPVAVGDHVLIRFAEEDAIIDKILPRKNYIIRKSVNLSHKAHIIAANMDQALLIVTVNYPQTSTGFIDRFLVTAEGYHIPVHLVFNKVDLCNDADIERMAELMALYENIGYPCHAISATNKNKVAQLKDIMKGKVTLISGHSGVGKSTLVNSLDEKLNVRIGEISESHRKGQHTTTFAEMHELSFGAHIIDTPGIKGFGVIDFDKDELGRYFPEMREKLPHCKFYNCTHVNEPGCAVKQALEEGEIAPSRYESYLNMLEDFDEEKTYR